MLEMTNRNKYLDCSPDLPVLVARGEDGTTTVTTTMIIAHMAGIKDITGGDSLASNIQLVLNNARLAAKTAALL